MLNPYRKNEGRDRNDFDDEENGSTVPDIGFIKAKIQDVAVKSRESGMQALDWPTGKMIMFACYACTHSSFL